MMMEASFDTEESFDDPSCLAPQPPGSVSPAKRQIREVKETKITVSTPPTSPSSPAAPSLCEITSRLCHLLTLGCGLPCSLTLLALASLHNIDLTAVRSTRCRFHHIEQLIES